MEPFKSNEMLRKLIYELFPEITVTLDEMVDNLRENETNDIGDMQGKLSEKWISMKLTKAQKILSDSIEIHPKELENQSGYRFERWNESYTVERRVGRTIHNYGITEYDALIKVEGLPTIIEICTGGKREMGRHLKEKEIEKKVIPVREAFQTADIAYVFFTYPELIWPGRRTNQQSFLDRGGLIVPFYSGQESYLKEVERVRAAINRVPEIK